MPTALTNGAGVRPTGRYARLPVLIVDDFEALTELYRCYLEERNFRVTTAGDGVSALEAIRTERPAVVVVDLTMPRLNGWQLIELLKRDPKRRDITVIALSGANARDSAIKLGADSYLAKPCAPPDLEAEM